MLVCWRNTEEDPSYTFVTKYQTTRCYMIQHHGRTRLISDNNWQLKAKLSLFLITQIYESVCEEEVQLHAFLISIFDGYAWSASRPLSLYSRLTEPRLPFDGGWRGGGRPGLGTPVRRNIFLMPGLYLRFNGRPDLSIVTILTELSLLHHMACLTYQK
jgi:hypothetical protein